MECIPSNVFLIVILLVCGSMNTLFTKWADVSEACGLGECDKPRPFVHPFVQAVTMFMGEALCLVAYIIHRLVSLRRDPEAVGPSMPLKRCLVFVLPAMCDMIGTATIYIGLTLTYASSFQMLRGSVIIFTALLSVAFNNRIIQPYMWLGMVGIICGLVLVGVSDIIFNSGATSDTDPNGIIAGDLLIIMAQVVSAVQMVVEEKYVGRFNAPPLLVVGLEGLFGFIILTVLLVPMYFIRAQRPFSTDPDGRLENVWDAFAQMGNNWQIVVATVGCILSIAVFNFSGISITKKMSATTRMVLDSGRTIIIWAITLGIGWQPFSYKSFLLQLAGFVLLFIGMLIYNDIFFRPVLCKDKLIHSTTPRTDDFNPEEEAAYDDVDERTHLLNPRIQEPRTIVS